MTATIESGFGSKLMSNGFMLNNELTDFSYDDVAQGRTVANRVQGSKRPRSAMSPTLIFDKDGKLTKGAFKKAEGIEVLDFAPGAELGAARNAHRDIGIAPERALLHVAVADAQPHHQTVQRPRVGHRLARRS